MRFEVVDDELTHGAARGVGGAADMGLEHRVLKLEKRVGHFWFVDEDVEPGAAEVVGREPFADAPDERAVVEACLRNKGYRLTPVGARWRGNSATVL